MKTRVALALSSLLIAGVTGPSVVDAAWIHSWPAEGDAQDAIGMADGTPVGNAGYSAGYEGQGFAFDGVDSSILFGTSPGKFGAGDFTIAFAIAAEPPLLATAAVPADFGTAAVPADLATAAVPADFRIAAAPAVTGMQVLSKRALCQVGNFWDVRMSTSGTVGIEVYGGGGNTGLGTVVSVTDGNFHTVVFTRRGSVVSAYVDGILRSRNDAAVVADVSNDAQLALGDGPCVNADGTVPFHGILDEIRLADSAEPYLLLGDFDCGDAALNGGVTANDALATLKTAVGTAECPLCACDVNGVAGVTASDALGILRRAVGQQIELDCPACEF